MTRSNAYLYGQDLARAHWTYTMVINALQDPDLYDDLVEDVFTGFCDAKDLMNAKRTILINRYKVEGWGR